MIRRLLPSEILGSRYSAEELASLPRFPLQLILHNLRSAYNVGAIFRTADAARIEKLFLCGITPTPPHREIVKTALGAVDTVPWEYVKDIRQVVRQLRNKHYKIAALEITTESRLYCSLSQNSFPLAIVIGNEISGIDDELLQFVDFALEIPMFGHKHSLNVSVATGIMLYEALRIYTENFTHLPDDAPSIQTTATQLQGEGNS